MHFKCPFSEDQIHSFTKCQPILSQARNAKSAIFEHIYGTLQEHKETIKIKKKNLFKFEQTRNHMKKKHLLPGGDTLQDPCTCGLVLLSAADIISS